MSTRVPAKAGTPVREDGIPTVAEKVMQNSAPNGREGGHERVSAPGLLFGDPTVFFS